MKGLRDADRLILTRKKINAIIDSGSRFSNAKVKSHSEQSIKMFYVDVGVINEVDTCPKIYGLDISSDVPFSCKPSLKKFFLDNIIRCTKEIHLISYGVSEVMHDDIPFGIDLKVNLLLFVELNLQFLTDQCKSKMWT